MRNLGNFQNVAKAMLGLRDLKAITFGPRPQDFYACNAPIEQLLALGIQVEVNSELDLLQARVEAAGAAAREQIAGMTPDLAVEILSPSNTRKEMARKRKEYFAGGASLVWEIDPNQREADVY